jgi:hypothetical protein
VGGGYGIVSKMENVEVPIAVGQDVREEPVALAFELDGLFLCMTSLETAIRLIAGEVSGRPYKVHGLLHHAEEWANLV